jgi:hypothetical protein
LVFFISTGKPTACYHRRVPEQDLKWWHVRWRLAARSLFRFAKILAPVCLLAAVAYGALFLLSPWLTAHRLSQSDSRLSIIPVEPPTKAEAPLSNVTTDCSGVILRLPNHSANPIHTESLTTVSLNDGFLECSNISQEPGVLEIMAGGKGAQKAFGKELLRSKFNFMQAAMNATPDRVKWWRLRNAANQRDECLLVTKSLALTFIPSFHASAMRPIYTIASGKIRGFQIGNPEVPPYDARLDWFDAMDHHFTLDITGPQRHGPILTQPELNAMIASIQPTPTH